MKESFLVTFQLNKQDKNLFAVHDGNWHVCSDIFVRLVCDSVLVPVTVQNIKH
jgi:hypothetical protein